MSDDDVTGLVAIVINSEEIPVAPGATIAMGGPIRETIMEASGKRRERTTGFAPGKISCSAFHGPKTDLGFFRDFKGGTVLAKTDTDQVFVCKKASQIGEVESSDGMIPLTFEGQPLEQIA